MHKTHITHVKWKEWEMRKRMTTSFLATAKQNFEGGQTEKIDMHCQQTEQSHIGAKIL